MFGKPEWFVKRANVFRVHPVTWRGWTYATCWATALGTPVLILLARAQWLEACVWLTGMTGLLAWDVRQIVKAMDPPAEVKEEEDVMYIVDKDDPSSLKTDKFDMRLS